MRYIGKWVFHSTGVVNEKDELVYLGAEEYLNSPMLYIDDNGHLLFMTTLYVKAE